MQKLQLDPDPPALLTVEEVADLLRVNRSWVYRRVATGELGPALRLGSGVRPAIRIPAAALRRFLPTASPDA